ncbi:hypothetical protein N7466_003469 [Penicillium verhagenii]|uniref:uncharacterized protein n=1 Tax=Penicillium verhagenii TaxID=1562060 RepID=UPI002544F7C8|nr:uncharacterized protein N7466_003469 [Penicillium verhagenii]KAJ5937019.1 hypothetical protein N7466_003469 [Penicillium verhagenii]
MEKLDRLVAYTWDASRQSRSSYGVRHVFGTKRLEFTTHPDDAPIAGSQNVSSPVDFDGASAPRGPARDSRIGTTVQEPENLIEVVACIGENSVAEERMQEEYQMVTSVAASRRKYLLRPVEIRRLPSLSEDEEPSALVCIYESPGPNDLSRFVDCGATWYHSRPEGDQIHSETDGGGGLQSDRGELMPLQTFLDFAIGAAECIEMLHSRQIVHGQIRGDTFHFSQNTACVRLIHIGAGLRQYDTRRLGAGSPIISNQNDATANTSYLSVEQTSRTPIQLDNRVDIYSLGVLLWSALVQHASFGGQTPMEIVREVLGQELPLASTLRPEVPEIIARIIAKATAKNVSERYNSVNGLLHDIVEARRLLEESDQAEVEKFKIASNDVSPFFTLPRTMVGRKAERDAIVEVLDRKHRMYQGGKEIHQSSVPKDQTAIFVAPTLPDASLEEEDEARNLATGIFSLPASTNMTSMGLAQSYVANASRVRSPGGSQYSPSEASESGSVALDNNNKGLDKRLSTLSTDGASGDGSSLSSGNARRQTVYRGMLPKGRCEIISIEAGAGLGKSRLIKSVQMEARRRGFFANSHFDLAIKERQRPVLNLFSSLFEQAFSENTLESSFLPMLRHHIGPAWDTLHKVLSLPKFLLGPDLPEQTLNKAARSSIPLPYRNSLESRGTESAEKFLRTGSSTKSLPLVRTLLDILRAFTQYKLVCLCLDDVHLADEESLELIAQIASARIEVVIILAYRPSANTSSEILTRILDFCTNKGVTSINLPPLSEDSVLEYVSSTLFLSIPVLLPLGALIQSRTSGNPFYVREMLTECYEHGLIGYDHQKGLWSFDLSRISAHFRADNYDDTNLANFLTKRLSNLPSVSKSILAWASVLGTTFSFQLVRRLLNTAKMDSESELSDQEMIQGLQATIQAYVIVPTKDHDVFSFTYNHYMHIAVSFHTRDQHHVDFIKAQVLLRYYSHDDKYCNMLASAILESAPIIKTSVARREPFRKFLLDYAKATSETGFRFADIKYYQSCILLLQEAMWDEEVEDVSYAETLQIFTSAAEAYLYRGQHAEASHLLDSMLSSARSPVDKAPSWILQCRMLAQMGNSSGAFQSLKEALGTLGIAIDDNPSFAKCDKEFRRLCEAISAIQIETIERTPVEDLSLAAIGAVLVEATSAAFWSDTITFYQMTLVMVETYLSRGPFPHAGMGLLQLAVIAITRHSTISFASHCAELALALIEQCKDSHIKGRGIALYLTFVDHTRSHIQSSICQMEGVLDLSIDAGDRSATILNYGLLSSMRFFASENLAELESFCAHSCEDISNWQSDTPGGTILITICQLCRALQGKTFTQESAGVMSDEDHSSTTYKSWLVRNIKNSDRPLMFYESMEIAPLFLYGHFHRAVALGNSCLKKVNAIWSARNTRFLMFFHSLALAGCMWIRKQQQLNPAYRARSLHLASDVNGRSLEPGFEEEMANLAKMLKYFRRKIEQWQVISDVNYLAWTKILGAQIAEMENDQRAALCLYQEALEHAALYGFGLEEALTNHLLGEHLMREGSSRLGTYALKEAVTLYRRMGATGVADHVLRLYNLEQNLKNVAREAATQTEHPQTVIPTRQVSDHGNDENPNADESPAERTLHISDLTSILERSQVISSILRVDELLREMCTIVLESCYGVAVAVAIITKEDPAVGWVVAASGEAAGRTKVHRSPRRIEQSSLVEESIVNYCVRFREAAYLPDVFQDPRFTSGSEAWEAQNQVSKSVVALPVSQGGDESEPLAVLYVEGTPNAFSYLNRVVLQLLVVQLGISYSNALTLKEVERVSAINQSMVDMQKKALAEAMAAEQEANVAKAEALHHAKLAEEAAKAKSSFLANISHELRTPLNGVIGNSELLHGSDLPEAQLEMADSIRVSANLLLAVINDILDFSKIEANKMQLHIVPFDVDKMIRGLIRSMSTDFVNSGRSNNVGIIQDIKIPQSRVYGDPVRLQQILGNLYGNSLKFTKTGSITIGSRADNETEDSVRLSFWVSDTGIGIPASLIKHLFKPFTQADASTARRFGGSGLGLSICKSLVGLMGGTIELESVENVGTTVSFSIVLSKVKLGDSGPVSPAESTSDLLRQLGTTVPNHMDLSQIPLSQLRVCIAEDNLINQKITVQFLKKLGFAHVDAYNNGLEAVEGIQKKASAKQPYHLILMDVQMPIMDGYVATRHLRQDSVDAVRRILVIALTASAIQGDREKCLDSGMDDYLAKPILLAALKDKLDKYLQFE